MQTTGHKPFLNVVLHNTEYDQGNLDHVALKGGSHDD